MSENSENRISLIKDECLTLIREINDYVHNYNELLSTNKNFSKIMEKYIKKSKYTPFTFIHKITHNKKVFPTFKIVDFDILNTEYSESDLIDEYNDIKREYDFYHTFDEYYNKKYLIILINIIE